MSKSLMNLFKHNSTRLSGRLSTKYPHTIADKVFLWMHGSHNLHQCGPTTGLRTENFL